jgi:2'-hydroxyisoflavone reductase
MSENWLDRRRRWQPGWSKIEHMRLLIIGGTWFLGRTLASDALSRGWQVTAFTRGRSGEPAAGVDHIRGDRFVAEDLARLASHGPWDATVDTSAYEPGDVTRVLVALADRAGRYVLVSTVSAYRRWPASAVNEDSELWPSRLDVTEVDHDVVTMPVPIQYGTLKAGCELAASTAPSGYLIVRPGVILGPGEYVGRMMTLLGRAARGGRWLLPSPSEQPIQPVDVRDAARFMLDRIEASDGGAYNLTAPQDFATYGDLISACIAETGGRARAEWVDPDWLSAHGVGQWTEIPLWRTAAGTWAVDSRRAQRAGFTCRPLGQTVADTLADYRAQPPVPHPRQAEHGITPEKEAELLRLWDDEMTLRRG